MIRVSPAKSILSLSEPAVVEKICFFPVHELWMNYIFRIVLAYVPPMFHQTYHHNNVDWKPISHPLCRPNEKPRKGCYEHCEADIYGILLLDPFREYQNLFFFFKRDTKQRLEGSLGSGQLLFDWQLLETLTQTLGYAFSQKATYERTLLCILIYINSIYTYIYMIL